MTTKKKDELTLRPKVPAKVRKLREEFKSLLLQSPNYFGNLEGYGSAVEEEPLGTTYYEEIASVGFQPEISRLEAVVFVYQETGYGTGFSGPGTPEYVRFYLSSDGGTTWEDQGVVQFTAYNIPEGTKGSKRLEYAVGLEISPEKKWCGFENKLMARAILSWDFLPPPDRPDFVPIWGNVHDTHILVDAAWKTIPFGTLLEAADLKLDAKLSQVVDPTQEVKLAPPPSLGLQELAELYQDKVEPKRFAFAHVKKLLAQQGHVEELLAAGVKSFFSGLKIDVPDLLQQLATDGDTSYEELECVGLDNERDELVAVIRVKKPYGYCGDLCKHGSTEYVTFWGDFDGNGTFETCLGTAQVRVYDIESIPEEGLEYSVQLPVNLHPYRQPVADGPRIVPIRAILSWQEAPPLYNSNYVPTWGNREETLVQIRPGIPVAKDDFTPFLYSLCNTAVCSIDQVTGWASGDRPFGGVVNIQGEIPAALALHVPDTLKYKISVRPLEDDGTPRGSWQPLANDFRVSIQEGIGPAIAVSYRFTQQVDPADGYYTYREYGTPPGHWRRVISPNRQLARWDTRTYGSGLWEIQILAKDLSGNYFVAGVTTCLVDGSTRQNVKVRLDQTRPSADVSITGFSRHGGPVEAAKDCGTFQVGDVIHGTYIAQDAPENHLRDLTLRLKPETIDGAAHRVLPSPSERSYYDDTDPVPGFGERGTWTLETKNLPPCGYTVRLLVHDRTIANCDRDGWWDDDYVGFCLVKPEHKAS